MKKTLAAKPNNQVHSWELQGRTESMSQFPRNVPSDRHIHPCTHSLVKCGYMCICGNKWTRYLSGWTPHGTQELPLHKAAGAIALGSQALWQTLEIMNAAIPPCAVTVYSDLATLEPHFVSAERQCEKWEGWPSFKAGLTGRQSFTVSGL